TNAFTRDVELLSDLLEGQLVTAFETETQLDDLGFAFVQRVDHRVEIPGEILLAQTFKRTDGIFVTDDLAESRAVAFFTNGRVERSWTDAHRLQVRDFRRGNLQLRRQLFVG